MRTTEEIEKILKNSTYKEIERQLDLKIRNGQTIMGVRKALEWVMQDNNNSVNNFESI